MSSIPYRRAIIIGSPGNPYLSGVKEDYKNWYKHLTSPQGGSWRDNELIGFWDPSDSHVNQILDTINKSVALYCLVVFSGHGYEIKEATNSPYNSHHINLTPLISCPIRYLLNNSPRQLLVIDSCRTSVQLPGLGDYFLPEPALYGFQIDTMQPFIEYAMRQPEGKVLLQSCAAGQISEEDRIGGYFTQSLFRWMWGIDKDRSNPYLVNSFKVASEALAIMRRTYPSNKQAPIRYAHEAIDFPLGVRFTATFASANNKYMHSQYSEWR